MQTIHVLLSQESSNRDLIKPVPYVLEHLSITPIQQAPPSGNKSNFLSPEDRLKLAEVKRIIEQNFLQEHTISSLCRQVGLNEFKLKKGFKMFFNTRVIQYVRQLRMEYAQELLRNNSTSIAAVSRQLGFSYPNHFSVAYKRHFGKIPSQR